MTQKIIDDLRILLGLIVIIVLLIAAANVMAVTTPQHTYSNDHFTVANTTDGEQVMVTYEVVFEHRGEMSTADRKSAIDNMALAQSCANERLDSWIQSHTAAQAQNSNLAEITTQCGNDDISIEQVKTSQDLIHFSPNSIS